MIHPDQGTQFGCDACRRFCRDHRLEPSMSRKGNCWTTPWSNPSSAVSRRSESRNRPTGTASWRRPISPTTSIPSTIKTAATATSEGSAPNSLKRLTNPVGELSTKSWDLHASRTPRSVGGAAQRQWRRGLGKHLHLTYRTNRRGQPSVPFVTCMDGASEGAATPIASLHHSAASRLMLGCPSGQRPGLSALQLPMPLWLHPITRRDAAPTRSN